MHPLGTYLAIKDAHREYGGLPADDPHATFARVDALPMPEPEPEQDREPRSRIARLAAVVRRRVIGTAGV
jgi:hypothetical protein